MRLIAALALLLVSFASYGQTCPAGLPDPVPRDAVRLNWGAVTTYTDGSTIVGTVTYTVYKRTGTTDAMVCTTTATNAGQTGLAVATHTYVVTARVGTGPESAKTAPASKDVTAPTPNVPPNLTIASNRIDPAEWTCRDQSGAILSSHSRQDKAMEACVNLALARVGTPYEIRPSGYRLVASLR